MTEDQDAFVYESIAGGAELLQWFGRVPRFHDAEITGIALNRRGLSTLSLHGWTMTDAIGADGCFVTEKHAVVTFRLEEIADLRLDGFNHQNVIGGLRISPVSSEPGAYSGNPSQEASEVFELVLEPCYGLSGYIRARGISVGFVPGKP